MKIIGKTSAGYIVETDANELSNLMGYQGDRTRQNELRNYNDLRVGDKIPIHVMYDRLFRMANMERELAEISAKLKAASDFVNTALPTIIHVNGDGKEDTKS